MADSIFAPMPSTERGTASKIDANMAGTKIVYPNGSTVVVRDVAHPGVCETYTEHTHHVGVARFSPNGAYIASGDVSGKVRMWAYTHPEHLLKKETPVLAGGIFDLGWDEEGKRIVACGDGGKSAHAKAFLAESGSALGEIISHTKPVLTVSYRPTKPYRVATGGQDFKVGIFVGPPFKFSHSHDHHTNFVQCIRYSPDGKFLCSVGSDKKVCIYAGDDADFKVELEGHEGGVFACSWDPKDSKTLMTCSADKTVKIWDVEAGKCVTTFDLAETSAKGTDAQQVCCVFAGKIPISLGLSGDLTYLDPAAGKPTSIIQAHSAPAVSVSFDLTAKKEPALFVGTLGGQTYSYSSDGAGKRLEGEGHGGSISGVSVSGGIGYSGGYDDTIRVFSGETGEYTGDTIVLGKQPINVSISSDNKLLATCSPSTLFLIRNNAIVHSLEVKFEATCCGLSPDGTLLAVGHKENGVHIFKVKDDKLVTGGGEIGGLFNSPTVVKFSPNGKFLAVADKHKEISLWATDGWANVVKDIWVFHQSSVADICFSPDGKFLVSGSVDSMIFVWNVESPMKRTKIMQAHPGGVLSVAFGNDGVVYSCGRDNCVKKWKPKLPV